MEVASGSDIVKGMWDFMSSKRDSLVAESSMIMSKKVETAKEQDQLNQRAEEIKERAAMLTRLQYCLEQDATKKKAELDAQDQKAANKSAPTRTAEQLQAQQDALDKLQTELNSMKADLEAKEKDLAERERALLARLAAVQKAEQEVEERAANPKYPGSGDFGGNQADAPNITAPTCPPPIIACPGDCSVRTDCSSCVADPKCGWCRSSQTCMNTLDGKVPAGNCSHADFSHLYCKSHTCEQHKNCYECMSDPECGLCAATGACQKGGLTGPETGSCSSWLFSAPMRIFSINVYGKDLNNVTARANNIFAMVEEANADFVCFQEVEDWFLEAMSQQPWAKSYHASDFGSGHAPGGLLCLSKVPLAHVAYYEKTQPGQVEVDQRGRLLLIKPKLAEQNLVIASTTLDWRSPENRADSLDYVFSVLNNTNNVVLMGDFNFDFGAQPESSRIPDKFKDVWLKLRPDRPGFTWDPIHNAYARASDPRSRPSRIDRMFVSSDYVSFNKISKVGSPDVSPHYGLLADVSLPGAFCEPR